MVQVRNNEGEIKERPMIVKEICNLPLGEKIVIHFEGNQPSGEHADGLLAGFLGQFPQDNKLFPICFENRHLVLSSYKDRVWNDVIKEMCKKNAQNRSKLKINHTSGSKKLKRE
ncbi:hypothetical protein E2542_SST28499 [Spatholobus suberectus]|nr:hypothetical protein E2542_SST28499 [Spatholobus suberectus]